MKEGWLLHVVGFTGASIDIVTFFMLSEHTLGNFKMNTSAKWCYFIKLLLEIDGSAPTRRTTKRLLAILPQQRLPIVDRKCITIANFNLVDIALLALLFLQASRSRQSVFVNGSVIKTTLAAVPLLALLVNVVLTWLAGHYLLVVEWLGCADAQAHLGFGAVVSIDVVGGGVSDSA